MAQLAPASGAAATLAVVLSYRRVFPPEPSRALPYKQGMLSRNPRARLGEPAQTRHASCDHLFGLIKRLTRLTGKIKETHKRLRTMIADLNTIDKTIVQFDPDSQVETIKPKAFRPPADWAHRGEMSKISLSILRQATEPMTTRDIALELLITCAMDPQDQRMLRTMVRRVGTALRTQRENGVVLSRQRTG